MKRQRRRALTLIGSLALALLYWISLLPLAVERTADGVKINVERLGEYNSPLTDFVIVDAETQSIVVRLIPKEALIAMWTLELRDGPNSVAPRVDTKNPGYVVQTPGSGAPAILKKGRQYKIEIAEFSMFGTEMLPFRLRRTTVFVL